MKKVFFFFLLSFNSILCFSQTDVKGYYTAKYHTAEEIENIAMNLSQLEADSVRYIFNSTIIRIGGDAAFSLISENRITVEQEEYIILAFLSYRELYLEKVTDNADIFTLAILYGNIFYHKKAVALLTEYITNRKKADKDAITIDVAYRMRGVYKNKLSDTRGALSDLTKAIELGNKDVETYFTRGGVYFNLKKYNESYLDFTKAASINKKCGICYYNIAASLYNLGKKDSACLNFSKAGELGYEEAYDTIKEKCK